MQGLFIFRQPELLLGLNFVTAQVFLGFGEYNVLAKFFTVLLQSQLLWGIHRILGSVVQALARFFAD